MNKKEEEKVILPDKNSASAQQTSLSGVDKQYTDKVNSTYTASDTQTKAQGKASNQLMNYENIANTDSIVSNKTWSTINSQFKTPKAVTEADAYLKGQLSKIQSGKTSYSDQITNLMSQITNRDKFSYDVDNDPLFQQALASAMNSGKSAMQDTIGQASALTGGYGSSYATSAANQAYNAYIEDAYNNLPQYYQMALDAYNAEGDEMYRQLDMYNTADATEYSRTLNAYDATGTYRDRLYNEAYQQFRDTKSDAFASANLQISEHGQLANDAYNLYNAYANEADKMYEREFQKWDAEVNNAMQYAQMLNSDYWSQTNFDEGVRQYDQSFAEEQRQFDEKLAFEDEWNQKNFDEGVRQFDTKLENDNIWKGKELDYQNAVLDNSIYEFAATHGDTNGDGKLDASEIAAWNKTLMKSSGSGGTGGTQKGGLSLTSAQLSAAIKANQNNGGGQAGLQAAVDTLLSMGVDPTPYLSELADALEGNYEAPKSDKITPNATGTVENFNKAKGSNFKININGTSQTVENHGKADASTKKELDKYDVSNGSAFVYNGEVYVKDGGAYYLVGNVFGGKSGYNTVFNTLK